MQNIILTFQINYEHHDHAPWFALPADKMCKPAGYEYLKSNFDRAANNFKQTVKLNMETPFDFDRDTYSKLKEFITSNEVEISYAKIVGTHSRLMGDVVIRKYMLADL